MLLGYGARNCWCFKEWLDIDLRLNGYVPENVSLNNDFSLIMGFMGANASGKTKALKVYAFIVDFVKNSFLYNPDSEINFDPYFDSSDDSEFYVEFRDSDNREYRYEAVLQKKRVIKETVFEILGNEKENILLEREFNTIKANKIFDNSINIILRNNASVISTLKQYAVEEINSIYSFFAGNLINVSYRGLIYEIDKAVPSVSKIYYQDPDALLFAKKLIKKFDTGISDIEIKYHEDSDGNKEYFPLFTHVNGDSFFKLKIHSESTGTRALFINLLYYYKSVNEGWVIILDEFDINLHPDIQPHLLELFTDSESNPHKAQMIFTSFNPEIMDILGKYRTYLFEKDKGECYGYRLDEPETNILRYDRSVMVPYRKHMLGGYPKIA